MKVERTKPYKTVHIKKGYQTNDNLPPYVRLSCSSAELKQNKYKHIPIYY